jgi:hypothetical protein
MAQAEQKGDRAMTELSRCIRPADNRAMPEPRVEVPANPALADDFVAWYDSMSGREAQARYNSDPAFAAKVDQLFSIRNPEHRGGK